MVSLKRMDHLRVVGSAFLIHGQVVYCGHDQHIEETYKGPCMLPPSPALYICGTDIKVWLSPLLLLQMQETESLGWANVA